MAPVLAALDNNNAAIVEKLFGTPVAVFIGGTSGIGQGMAETFARWRDGKAHIVIVGRNEAAAKDIISHFPKATGSETWSHKFVHCDVTLMKNVHIASQTILEKYPKINFLILSPGFFSTSGRDETLEGIDKTLAVHYYARWKFIDELLYALKKANEEGEDARVMSVLAAGRGGKIESNNLGLKKGYSFRTATEAATTYNDLMVESFQQQNPGIIFSHSFPGAVLTNIMSSAHMPWLRAVAPVANLIAKPFTVTQNQCAEYLWSGLLNGTSRIGKKGEDIGKTGYYGNDELRQKLWEHTEEVTKV
ncbi:Oxidoreductase [Psilocybe cubensis]|uniref:NAD(P)-binding protein n=2 Tax=Psilocybe cubensis TaxID=181762 RepID=A0A8H7Y3V7_PSICU|nr:Oxidoreductase [Psilocybe cubensis]KAH9485709.1 Oxidoreductase [Psilocybe cubensis]